MLRLTYGRDFVIADTCYLNWPRESVTSISGKEREREREYLHLTKWLDRVINIDKDWPIIDLWLEGYMAGLIGG